MVEASLSHDTYASIGQTWSELYLHKLADTTSSQSSIDSIKTLGQAQLDKTLSATGATSMFSSSDIDLVIRGIDYRTDSRQRIDSTGSSMLHSSSLYAQDLTLIAPFSFESDDISIDADLEVATDSFFRAAFHRIKNVFAVTLFVLALLAILIFWTIRQLLRLQVSTEEHVDFIGDLRESLQNAAQSMQAASANQLKYLAEENIEEARKLGSYLHTQSSRLHQMMCELEDETEEQPITLHKKTIDLPTLVMHCIRDLSIRYGNPSLHVHTEFHPDTIPLYVDPHHFKIALINLLDNAFIYNDGYEDLRVECIARLVKDEVRITISDNGKGVDQSQIPFLGRKFYRTSEYAHIPGLGLGLYQVRRIIAAHGGSMSFLGDTSAGLGIEICVPTHAS